MNILAIDTCASYSSVALLSNDKCIDSHKLAKNSQSKCILEQIKQLLKQSAIDISQVNVIAYGGGPGSFTGVRLAASIATGLAVPHNIQITGLSCTLTIAYEVFVKTGIKNVAVLQDARRNQIYYAQYLFNENSIDIVHKDTLIEYDQANKLINSEMAVCGSGLELVTTINSSSRLSDFTEPKARSTALLAQRLINKKELEKFSFTSPNYIRNKVVD